MEATLPNQPAGRILIHEKFDGNGFTNNNSLAQMRLTKADQINPVITHLMGREDRKFPLTFLTEGQKGGMKRIEVEDVEYNWPVISRIVITSYSIHYTKLYDAQALAAFISLFFWVPITKKAIKNHFDELESAEKNAATVS